MCGSSAHYEMGKWMRDFGLLRSGPIISKDKDLLNGSSGIDLFNGCIMQNVLPFSIWLDWRLL